MMSSAFYDRDSSELLSKGLYLDLPAWGYHIFEVGIAFGKPSATEGSQK